MAEYIEREALLKHSHIGMTRVSDTEWQRGYWDGVDDMAEYIREEPAVDVAEVVRCKDCVYCCISTDPKTNISIQKCGYVGFNPVQSSQVSDDFYCSHGERQESK